MLQDEVRQLSTDFGRLVSEVSALRSAAAGIQTLSKEISVLETQIGQKLSHPVVEQLSTDFNELHQEVSALWRFPGWIR
jgi:outer membrane murein-binding lipoprotein Lpp